MLNSSLDNYQNKKDHRQLNKNLKMFLFLPAIGSSLPIWLPRGEIVKKLIKDFLFHLEKDANFLFLSTPILGNEVIYQKSGHLNHYKNYIFPPLKINNQKMLLRPMTCPHHCLVFAHQKYSYQDLPIRFSENSYLFRYEASGAIHGLERVRQMELKDAHIFLPQDESIIVQEIKNCFFLVQKVFAKLNLTINNIYLSLPDFTNQAKFHSNQELWTKAETILVKALQELGTKYKSMPGEAAFYGPKIDFQVNTPLNHDLTVATIQIDFLLAAKFQLQYRTSQQIAAKTFATPVILHYGIIGSYERLLALLLEANNGWLPFWLSPCQIMVFALSNALEVQNYLKKVVDLLKKHHLRVEIADSKKKLQENIRKTWEMKIPLQLFIGQKEMEKQKVNYLFYQKPQEKFFHTIWQLLNKCMEWNN